MDKAKEAALTMKAGGGIGYNFSTLRPRGDNIRSINAPASGPVSFMQIYDAVCKTVASAGNRRGAQMGLLQVDHPSIREFIHAKQNTNELTAFNISIGITNEFMFAVKNSDMFPLRWGGVIYEYVSARALFDEIMRSTFDWAEPGVIFLDTIYENNNLWYCEKISGVNPCSEQCLPAYGTCLLGSLNLVKYVEDGQFHMEPFKRDVEVAVRALDHVIEVSLYPLDAQKTEALNKRRMGLGITGLANALEACGYWYGTPEFVRKTQEIMECLRNEAYLTSVCLAKEKGAFPLFDPDNYLYSRFTESLPKHIRQSIRDNGIRNSHLISIAPTGTISLCADNVSSGIEPVFAHSYTRDILMPEGLVTTTVDDYGYRVFGVKGRTAHELSADEHLDVLLACQPYVDSSISKTVNVAHTMPFKDFERLYFKAWEGGAKGLSTFTDGGKRSGILRTEDPEPYACSFDPETGTRTCDQ